MKKHLSELMTNESGLILSAEMVMILTICVLGVVVGLTQLQTAIVTEFQDLSLAFSGFNQSYATPAFFGCRKWSGQTSWTASSGFIDFYNGCFSNGIGGVGYGGGYGGFGGGYGGFGGGYGGGYGGYSEIGGVGYAGIQGSTTTVLPQSTVTPCETCTPGTQDSLSLPQGGASQDLPQTAPLPPAPMPVPDSDHHEAVNPK
ncbi:MAG: hypothetical protein JSS49_15995 [Planctomycetes bacterium]|nr:hypothetical protein [Planctomycetota bacterium]